MADIDDNPDNWVPLRRIAEDDDVEVTLPTLRARATRWRRDDLFMKRPTGRSRPADHVHVSAVEALKRDQPPPAATTERASADDGRPDGAADDRDALLERIRQLEDRLATQEMSHMVAIGNKDDELRSAYTAILAQTDATAALARERLAALGGHDTSSSGAG